MIKNQDIKLGARGALSSNSRRLGLEASPITADKFCCARCGAWKSRVVSSRPDTQGTRYLRWRECAGCQLLYETAEAVTAEDGGDADQSGAPRPRGVANVR